MKKTAFTFLISLCIVLFTYQAHSQAFPIETGNDVDLNSDAGYLRLGTLGGINMILDQNEIQARSNGNASTLFVNLEGGSISLGTTESTTTNSGFMKLGSSAPAIKTKFIQDVASGPVIAILHGLVADKILSVDVISLEPSGGTAGDVYRIKDIISITDSSIFIEGGIPQGASYRVFITYRI